jgi:hypothetical protein
MLLIYNGYFSKDELATCNSRATGNHDVILTAYNYALSLTIGVGAA